MFIKKGSTRTILGFPVLGIVIKVPRTYPQNVWMYYLKRRNWGGILRLLSAFVADVRNYFICILYGISANKAEVYLWKKTHNPLLAPVLLSFFGLVVVMRYYPAAVKRGSGHNGLLTSEVLMRLSNEQCFTSITERILGTKINNLFADGHDAQGQNFRINRESRLVMIDYGISCIEHQERFEEFLDRYGQKLVDEYVE